MNYSSEVNCCSHRTEVVSTEDGALSGARNSVKSLTQ